MKNSTNSNFDWKNFLLENNPKMQQLKARMTQATEEEGKLNQEKISLTGSHKLLVDKQNKDEQTSFTLKTNLTQNNKKLDNLDSEIKQIKLKVLEQDNLKETMKLFLGNFSEHKDTLQPIGKNTGYTDVEYEDIIDKDLNQDI